MSKFWYFHKGGINKTCTHRSTQYLHYLFTTGYHEFFRGACSPFSFHCRNSQRALSACSTSETCHSIKNYDPTESVLPRVPTTGFTTGAKQLLAHTQAVKADIPSLFSATRFVTYIRQKVKTTQPIKEDTQFILLSILQLHRARWHLYPCTNTSNQFQRCHTEQCYVLLLTHFLVLDESFHINTQFAKRRLHDTTTTADRP